MKNLFKFASIFAMALVAAFSLSSCLSDNEENTIKPFTSEEKKQAIEEISATYSGFYILSSDEHSDMRFQIASDSTMIVENLPIKKFASFFSTNYPDVATLLSTAEDQTIHAVLHPLYKDQGINAYMADYKTLDFKIAKAATEGEGDGEEVTDIPVTIKFTNYITYSGVGTYGSYSFYKDNTFEGNIIFKSFTVNGLEINANFIFTFQGTKSV